jgi:uncharacterized protein (DUF305 family)
MGFSVSIALRSVAGGCLLALLLGAGACAAGTVGTSAPVAVTSSAAPGSPGFFGGTDLAWVEITIAMNEELLPLLDLAPTHGADGRLRALAAAVKAGHEQELGVLRGLHDQAKLPSTNPHKGMPMPGMVMPSQVAAAAALRGAEFDKVLREHLRAHLEQSQKLAASERSAGSEPRTIALAVRISETRQSTLNIL